MYLNSQFSIPSMAPVFIILWTFSSDKYSISTCRWALHPSPHCSLEHQWAPYSLAFSWGSQWSHWKKMGRWEQSEVNTFILLLPLCYVHGGWAESFYQWPHHFSGGLYSCVSGTTFPLLSDLWWEVAPSWTVASPGCFIIPGWFSLALSIY